MSNESSSNTVGNLLWFIFNLVTAIIGYHIHNSIFFSIIDFIFSPIVWTKWLCFQEVNLTIIHDAFAFFLK